VALDSSRYPYVGLSLTLYVTTPRADTRTEIHQHGVIAVRPLLPDGLYRKYRQQGRTAEAPKY